MPLFKIPQFPKDTGSLAFRLVHPHPDWVSNSHSYSFPPSIYNDVNVGVLKNSDCTVTVVISNLRDEKLVEFTAPIPPKPPGQNGLFVGLNWDQTKVELLLYAKVVATHKG